MKKLLSLFVSLALTVSMVPAVAFADTPASSNGEFLLVMNRRVAVEAVDFTATLRPSAGSAIKTLALKAEKGQETSEAFLSGIVDGTYELTISAPKYVTYRQTLVFDGRCVKINLYNYLSANDGLVTNGKMGVMPYGDMNGDGRINDTDADLVKNAISANNKAYDVSGDGTVDLEDVSFVVRNEGNCVAATPVHTYSSTALKNQVNVAAPNNTKISGNAANLIDQNSSASSVSVSNSKNATISASNPVTLNIQTKNSSQTLDRTTQGLVIAPPENSVGNSINKGTVTVEGTDEAGNPITIPATISGTGTTKSANTVSNKNALAAPQAVSDADAASDASAAKEPEQPEAKEVQDMQGAANDATAAEPANDAADSAQADPSKSGAKVIEADAKNVAAEEITKENDGTIVINLGTRVAIKKVTIFVTGTTNNTNLAQIAKVEFLSNFAERIAEPQLSIPTVRSVSNTNCDGLGYKSISIGWSRERNITGYEVSVSGPGYNKTALVTNGEKHTFVGDSFNGTVKSFNTYNVKVRSVNGDWRSEWSPVHQHYCTCTNVPPAPQYVNATPLVERIMVSWNCKYDAEDFDLYYRDKAEGGDYTRIQDIKGTSYSLSQLKANATYQVYVVAHNRNGYSGRSAIAVAKTLESKTTVMPKCDLINTNDSAGMATNNIKSVYGVSNKYYELRSNGGKVTNSKATYNDWKAILDNNPDTYLYINDWDSGVCYANFRGPIINLQSRQEIDTFRLATSDKVSQPDLFGAIIGYKDYDKGGTVTRVNATISKAYDGNNRLYYEIVADVDKPINSDYFELRLRTFNTQPITIQELKIYKYNSLDDDIAAIWADQNHTMVKPEVTLADIQALIDRSNTVDPISGELHPHHKAQMVELSYALDIVQNGTHGIDYVSVDNQVTSRGEPALGIGQGLSDYQPMGYVANESDVVVVYVTDNTGRTARGSNANLNLICTQTHPEVSSWCRSIPLKGGRNEIVIPRIISTDKEHGGALYLQYTGNKGYNEYNVRILGATKIPMLNVAGLTGTDRRAAIEKYVDELSSYSSSLSASHKAKHEISSTNGNTNASVDYAYSATECTLNHTDIRLNYIMYSFPASQVNSALGANSTKKARADKLETTLAGMESQIEYFYQFKGMHKYADDDHRNDRFPNCYLNIRYHKMFTGAFMYAAGKHIGIEWGSVGGLFGLEPLTVDKYGKRISGRMTGWGVAHEIGHVINAGAYQRVEVTNNMFAQLAKVGSSEDETSSTFRTSYNNVYEGVVTGNMCHTGSLSVQLAQYWQLHLAYDDYYSFKKFTTHAEQRRSLFYARMESYLRNPSTVTKAFTKGASGDQLFMQAACLAAGKNILEYFRAWGYAPNADTVKYANQFVKETRAIQYINDDARLWRIEKNDNGTKKHTGMSSGTTVTASITNATNNRTPANQNKVVISLGNTNTNTGAMLGYEIKRDGKVCGFVTADKNTFTDILTVENNKAFNYEVTAIDKLCNKTASVKLPEVKVCHDGTIDKKGWTATSTTAKSKQDVTVQATEDDPDPGVVSGTTAPGANVVSAASNVLDNDANTIFCAEGGTSPSTRPNIVIDMQSSKQITALKYTPAKKSYSGSASNTFNDADMYKYRPYGYKIELSTDGNSWTTVKEGSLYKNSNINDPSTWEKNSDILVNADSSVAEDRSITIYFSQWVNNQLSPYMYTYDARYVRLTATNMSVFAASEIDILGPTNDNVDITAYGNLSNSFKYDPDTNASIPKGARVVYGEFKGDPAYNVVVLKDQNGNVVNGQCIILADVAEKGMLGETSDGRWVFWMEGNDLANFNSKNVTGLKAELYRVQDALTLAGQRLTSTSLTKSTTGTLQNIQLTSSSAKVQGTAAAKSMAKDATSASPASAVYKTDGSTATDRNGKVIFDEAATVETYDASEAIEGATTKAAAEIATPGLGDAVEAGGGHDHFAEASAPVGTLSVSKANAKAASVKTDSSANEGTAVAASLASAATDTIDINQAALTPTKDGFNFNVNPASIAIATEGVFTLDPAVSNARIALNGLAGAKSANNTYKGSYYDTKGRLHVFVIARSGTLGSCVSNANRLSFTGSITGLGRYVKGAANYLRDLNGDYTEAVKTDITSNNVAQYLFANSSITSAVASPDTYTYTKRAITPKLVVKAGSKTLKAGRDYTVSYSGSRKSIGAYKATVKGKGDYFGTKTVTFYVGPKSTSLKKATAKKRAIALSFKKQTKYTTGYMVRYSTDKSFKKSVKTKTFKGVNKTSATIKGLKSKKTYYVQVCTYKKVGKSNVKGVWSKSKKVKVR